MLSLLGVANHRFVISGDPFFSEISKMMIQDLVPIPEVVLNDYDSDLKALMRPSKEFAGPGVNRENIFWIL